MLTIVKTIECFENQLVVAGHPDEPVDSKYGRKKARTKEARNWHSGEAWYDH
jgi:hypothetical protein